jgi:two-component system chemotaxis sensor kinase CheA
MDVVRKGIEALKGTVQINSKLGKGTTITLKLPLTLAIIEGLHAKIGQEHFMSYTL